MTAEDEAPSIDEIIEAKRHIYSIDEAAYKRLTGRSLEEMEFELVTGVGETSSNSPYMESIDTALVSMYRSMKERGIEFALGLRFETGFISDTPRRNVFYAYATGVKRRTEGGEN